MAYFAEALQHIVWQPSEWCGHASKDFVAQDLDDICRSISAWSEHLPNVLPPLALNAADTHWPTQVENERSRYVAVIACNLAHIAPPAALLGLLTGAGRVLQPKGYLFLYGPFAQAGEELTPGNATFDSGIYSCRSTPGVPSLEFSLENPFGIRSGSCARSPWLRTRRKPRSS